MNKEIYLIDMRYSSHGHYLGDLKEFLYLQDQIEIKYLRFGGRLPAANSRSDVDSITRPISYWSLFKLLLTDRGMNKVFLSCSYIPLFCLSLLTLNFNYYFRFTSMPSVRRSLYKVLIKLMNRLCAGTLVCDYPVKEYLVNELSLQEEKVHVLIGRTIDSYRFNAGTGSKKNVAFVGALNAEKDLTLVLKVLSEVHFDNINFVFASKGIRKAYPSELLNLERSPNSVLIVDDFLPDEEYNKLIANSDYLLIPYTRAYGVRASAVLFDAMKFGKKAITVSLPQFEFYKEKYGLCFTYFDYPSLVNSLNALSVDQHFVPFSLFESYSKSAHKEQFLRLNLI